MKNIEINYKNESGYEVLYPKTNLEQIEGFQEFREGIYNKEEVDGIIDSLRGQTGNLKFAMGSYVGQRVASSTGWANITLPFSYSFLLLSYIDDSDVFPRICAGAWQDETLVFLGFGENFGFLNVHGIEKTSDGFRARNIEVSSTDDSIMFQFNLKGYTYNYMAFG